MRRSLSNKKYKGRFANRPYNYNGNNASGQQQGLFCSSESHNAAFFQGELGGTCDGVAGDGYCHP